MEFIIPMPVRKDYYVMTCRIKAPFVKEAIIMTGITEKEYNHLKLSSTNDLTLDRGNREFVISPENVISFGSVDFDEKSKDYQILNGFKWLNDNIAYIPSRYDYDTHSCKSNNKKYKWTETHKPAELCKYVHGFIGKPKYVLIFKEEYGVKSIEKRLPL